MSRLQKLIDEWVPSGGSLSRYDRNVIVGKLGEQLFEEYAHTIPSLQIEKVVSSEKAGDKWDSEKDFTVLHLNGKNYKIEVKAQKIFVKTKSFSIRDDQVNKVSNIAHATIWFSLESDETRYMKTPDEFLWKTYITSRLAPSFFTKVKDELGWRKMAQYEISRMHELVDFPIPDEYKTEFLKYVWCDY